MFTSLLFRFQLNENLTMFVCLLLDSAKATDEYELARKKVAGFINAPDSGNIVFTKNATEAINLVAYSWGLSNLKPGDEVTSSLVEAYCLF